jgi:hypothetical protein
MWCSQTRAAALNSVEVLWKLEHYYKAMMAGHLVDDSGAWSVPTYGLPDDVGSGDPRVQLALMIEQEAQGQGEAEDVAGQGRWVAMGWRGMAMLPRSATAASASTMALFLNPFTKKHELAPGRLLRSLVWGALRSVVMAHRTCCRGCGMILRGARRLRWRPRKHRPATSALLGGSGRVCEWTGEAAGVHALALWWRCGIAVVVIH